MGVGQSTEPPPLSRGEKEASWRAAIQGCAKPLERLAAAANERERLAAELSQIQEKIMHGGEHVKDRVTRQEQVTLSVTRYL